MRTSASEPETPEPVHFARSRSRSWSRRNVLLGAGAGAGAGILPEAGAGAGADQKCHGSASLLMAFLGDSSDPSHLSQAAPSHISTLKLVTTLEKDVTLADLHNLHE